MAAPSHQERRQFTRAGDGDDAGWFAPADAQPLPLAVQPLLGAPRDGAHARVLPGLAADEGDPDVGASPVVGGGLDRQPARVRRPGLGDRALAAVVVAGVLRRHDSQNAGEQPGVNPSTRPTLHSVQEGATRPTSG
jgi:hypothetical protein